MAGQASQDKLFEEIVQASNMFEQFEKAFQEVLMELEGDEAMEAFRKEYDTLHMSFVKAHENEKRLIKRSQDLASEINVCRNKVRTAEELSQGDQQTIEALRKEIGKAKNKLETSREKEVTTREKIKQLRVEIRDLENQVKKGVSGLVGHDATISELQKVRDDLTKERDTQSTQLMAIRSDIAEFQDKIAKLQAQKQLQDEELDHLRTEIQAKHTDLHDQKLRKEQWEKELKVMKHQLQLRGQDIGERQATLQQTTSTLLKLDEQLIDQKAQMDKAIKEYDNINKKAQRYQQDLEEEIQKNGQITAENQSLNQALKAKDAEITSIRNDISKHSKAKDQITKKNGTLDDEREVIEEERNRLKLLIQGMDLEISHARKSVENDRKQIDDLKRERDILNKNYLKAQASTVKQADWVLIKENQKRNLEQEVHGFERHAHKQRGLIYQLQKESEQYDKEAEEAAHKYHKAVEAVKTQVSVVQQCQRAIGESETKLKQQQNLFDTVLNERNAYSKQLLELHSEINEMRRRFRIMNHTITQLKDEIQQKEKSLVDEHIQHQKLQKERTEYQHKIGAHRRRIDQGDKKLGQLTNQINDLNRIINEADQEKKKQRRDYENVMNERDILGNQLVTRNDELAKLYERIRIQQSELNKGELTYADRLMQMRRLSNSIRILAIELQNVHAYISRLPELQREVNKRDKDLTKEKARVKALIEESENPLNVHRWHNVRTHAPQTYELIKRIHTKQQQLIATTEQVQQTQGLIDEKDKLFLELKSLLARQPGPEVAEQLNVYAENSKRKAMQLKSLKASLAHFASQAAEYSEENKRLDGQWAEMKEEYTRTQRQKLRGTTGSMGGTDYDNTTQEQREVREKERQLEEKMKEHAETRRKQEESKQAAREMIAALRADSLAEPAGGGGGVPSAVAPQDGGDEAVDE